MKLWQIYACFSLTALFLTGCWVQEAPVEKKKALFIVADYLTKEDSAVINRFSSDRHIAVTITILSAEEIVRRVQAKRYNAEMDILLTENESLRQQLYDLGAFRPVGNQELFSKLDRQFNNKHHYWLPVSHDPLIVTSPKDTSDNCPEIDFTAWHRLDSLLPVIRIKQHMADYTALLQNSHHLGWLSAANKKATTSATGERIYPLSEFVALENAQDSTYNKRQHACRSFLVDNKRFITRTNTVSIYAHGRNHAAAEKFVHVFMANAYTIANGRNQLPVNKRVQANWYIRSLSIR